MRELRGERLWVSYKSRGKGKASREGVKKEGLFAALLLGIFKDICSIKRNITKAQTSILNVHVFVSAHYLCQVWILWAFPPFSGTCIHQREQLLERRQSVQPERYVQEIPLGLHQPVHQQGVCLGDLQQTQMPQGPAPLLWQGNWHNLVFFLVFTKILSPSLIVHRSLPSSEIPWLVKNI